MFGVTRPNLKEDLYHSQLYHLDKPDAGILTLFLNVFDVKEENGPFTVYCRRICRSVCEKQRATIEFRYSAMED